MSRSKEFEEFSREEIQKDPNISANEIIRKAQNKGIGIQRKKALEIIRQIKGKKKKSNPEKYIPNKYKKRRKIVIHKPQPSGAITIKRTTASIYGEFGKYLGKIYVRYFNSNGREVKKWITTGVYPNIDLVKQELRAYVDDLYSHYYDVNSILYLKYLIYRRDGEKFYPIREKILLGRGYE